MNEILQCLICWFILLILNTHQISQLQQYKKMSLHYQSYADLLDKIRDSLRLPPNDMLTFCEKLADTKQIYSAYAQLINESKYNFSLEEKQSLATNFNFLVQRSLKQNSKNPQLWEIYSQQFATKKESEPNNFKQQLNNWKLSKILSKSFQQLVYSFQQQFTPIFQSKYFKLNFNHKLHLQQIMRNGDIATDASTTLIQQTFRDYINIGFQQISRIIQLDKADKIQQLNGRFFQYLKSIRDTLFLVNHQYLNEKLSLKISQNQQLFILMRDCLFIDFFNKSTSKTTDNQKIPSLFNFHQCSNIQQCKNKVKAVALDIFMLMVNNFSRSCALRQFDEYKILGFMQNLVPALVHQLSQTNVKKLNLSCNEELTIAMMKTIKKGASFLFLNHYFSQNYRGIFWKIIYPLLVISDEQIRQYEDDPQGFIAQSDSINEKDEDDQQLVQTCKTHSVFLLQELIKNIDGALFILTEQILSITQSLFSSSQNELSEKIQKQYKIKAKLQTCFTYLSVLTSKIQNRKQLASRIREIFIQHKNKILQLKKVQKARMVIYLCYNLEIIFKDRSHDDQQLVGTLIRQIYILVADCLQQDQLLTKCAIVFYQSNFKFEQSAQIVRDRLIELIQTTKFIDVLQTVTKIIYQAGLTLTHEAMLDIVAKLLRRIMNDNQIYLKAIKNHQNGYSNICMLKCIQTVKVITVYYAKMGNTELFNQAMGQIWGIFDLMPFIGQANYGEDIIKIFNIILNTIPKIDKPDFYQFLDNFGQYHIKQKEIGTHLFQTYLILTKKGEEYLLHNNEGHRFLNQIVENVMHVVNFQYRYRSMVAIILLQYIFINFPRIEFKHQWIYEKTDELFTKRYDLGLKEQNLAAIFNLWIIGSALSPAYDLGQIDCLSLNCLYGYHAKIFAIGINMKVQELMRTRQSENNIAKIIYLLRKSIEFLKLYENQNKNIKSKITQIIPQFEKVSPNQKIRQALVHIKKVDQNIYKQIIRQLEQDITHEDLKKLLNKTGLQNRVIFKFAK